MFFKFLFFDLGFPPPTFLPRDGWLASPHTLCFRLTSTYQFFLLISILANENFLFCFFVRSESEHATAARAEDSNACMRDGRLGERFRGVVGEGVRAEDTTARMREGRRGGLV